MSPGSFTRHIVRTDEPSLVRALRATDESVAIVAYETIFRAYFAPLSRAAERYVHSAAYADELVQEVLFRVWQKRATLVIDKTLAVYLYTAVRNAALNALRADDSETRTLSAAQRQGIVPGMAEPAASRIEDERVEHILRVAVALAPRCREVFFLKWEQGLTYADIAEVMGISVKTVEMQMTIALKAIRRAVRPAE